MNDNIFSKILIPIDGSTNSMKAIDYAVDLADKYKSELLALHVLYSQSGFAFHKETVAGAITSSSLNDLNLDAKQEAEKWFKEINEKAEKRKVQIKTEVVFTVISIVEGILTYAEKENINLIIIGSKGKSGWKKLIVGSVASGISTYAHCPILIVK
ncbi:MAG TPA: universal stress protein [Candidatus Nitrosocosmicus sp.]|nr:universal stress protein [Candidatus Nitrosocosmicus sp.]